MNQCAKKSSNWKIISTSKEKAKAISEKEVIQWLEDGRYIEIKIVIDGDGHSTGWKLRTLKNEYFGNTITEAVNTASKME